MNRIRDYIAGIKTLEDVGAAFAIAAFVLVGIGGFLNFQFMVNLGFAAFGASIIAWGINAMQRDELTPIRGLRVTDRISDALARAWGLLFSLGGLLLMGHGILSVLNPRSPYPLFLRQFFNTLQGYGVLTLIGGLIGLLFALSAIFADGSDAKNPVLRVLMSIPGRLFGIVLLLFFGALTLIALLAIVQPAALDTYIQSLYQSLGIP